MSDDEKAPGSAVEEELEDEEEMRKRHKTEVRSLEGKTRAMLKKAPKPKKHEVEQEVKALEAELAAKHDKELAALAARLAAPPVDGTKTVNFVPTPHHRKQPQQPQDEELEQEGEGEDEAAKRRDKARRKKDKKAQRAAEEEAKKELERQEILKGAINYRELEMGELREVLSPLGLDLCEIAADGHCLYRAVAHQLARVGVSCGYESYEQVRKAAATYMRTHPDDFLPFLDVYDQPDVEPYEALLAYCDKVEHTAEWGGQLELRALCHVLQRPIVVYSADGPPVRMGQEFQQGDTTPLRLTYHRHYYALGEHYNAVVPLPGAQHDAQDGDVSIVDGQLG